jgi:hypothetical protein
VHLDRDKQSAAHNTWYKKLPGYRVIQWLYPAPNFLYVDKELPANGNFPYHQRSVQFASAVFQGIMQKYNKVLKKLELGSGVICSSFG